VGKSPEYPKQLSGPDADMLMERLLKENEWEEKIAGRYAIIVFSISTS